MLRTFILSILVAITGFLISCNRCEPDEFTQKVLGDDEFVKYYSDSTYWVRCFYMPKEFLAINEMKKSSDPMLKLTSSKFNEVLKQFENGDYFRITMGLKSGANLLTYDVNGGLAYSQRLSYLNNVISNDILLYDYSSGKIIKPLTASFTNNYGMASTVELIVVFPKGCEGDDITLKYNDRLFGISKTIEFSYRYSRVNRIKYKILF